MFSKVFTNEHQEVLFVLCSLFLKRNKPCSFLFTHYRISLEKNRFFYVIKTTKTSPNIALTVVVGKNGHR